jgi:hypothetical protein
MPLKPIDKSKNPGLAKLPTDVRNKMGYMKDGGAVGKAKGEDIQVKEVDALITQLRNKSKGMSSEALRTFKQRIKYNLGKKDGGAVKREKKKEDKPQGIDPLGLMKPKGPKKVKEIKPKKGVPLPMTPDLIEKAKEGKYPNPRAPKIDRDEVIKAKPLKEGGMVLEIGLRPASKQEMKMAKEMKPQKKANGGMVARGTGAAIRGKGFKGVF